MVMMLTMIIVIMKILMMVLLIITLVKRQRRLTTFLFGGKGLKRMHDSLQINEAGAPSHLMRQLLTVSCNRYFFSWHYTLQNIFNQGIVCFICMSRYSTLRQQREHFKPTEILLEIDHVDNDIAGYLAVQRIKLDC